MTIQRRLRRLACVLVAASSMGGAWAGLGTSPADKPNVQALRTLKMHQFLQRSGASEWQSAAEKLPEKCHNPAVLDRKDCDDQLRCGWLAARVAVGRAWSGQVVGGKAEAASFLHRASRRLAVGGLCSRKAKEQAIWAADRQTAAGDDALVHLALLAESAGTVRGPLLEPSKEKVVRRLVGKARKEGLASLDPKALAPRAIDLRTAWVRGSWLQSHPVVERLRTTIPALWEPAGGIPKGCGEELLDPGLLDDQWRGYLVREVIFKALTCVAERLPGALEARGQRLAHPEDARIVARGLASIAQRDRGGRGFARDQALMARIGELQSQFQPQPQAGKANKARQPARQKAVATGPKTRKKKGKAPSGQRASSSTASKSRPARSTARSSRDRELTNLARRVGDLVGGAKRLEREASRARTSAERERMVKQLVVTAHRAICAPLEKLDGEDLDAVRRIFAEQGVLVEEGPCRASEGRDSLEALLAAAPGLEKLDAAAKIRAAARDVAGGQPVRARHKLDSIDEGLRGTTWIVIYAWAARQEGDPVAAERALAHLNEATLDRLRATGSEDLARIVAHAWVSNGP